MCQTASIFFDVPDLHEENRINKHDRSHRSWMNYFIALTLWGQSQPRLSKLNQITCQQIFENFWLVPKIRGQLGKFRIYGRKTTLHKQTDKQVIKLSTLASRIVLFVFPGNSSAFLCTWRITWRFLTGAFAAFSHDKKCISESVVCWN